MAQLGAGLAEPGGEEERDLRAAARRDEASADGAAVDDDERRHLLDAKALEQVRPLLLDDVLDEERVVVAPALEDLGEEAVYALAPSGALRAEVGEDRLAVELV